MLREYRGALFFLFMKRNMHENLKTPPCPRVYLLREDQDESMKDSSSGPYRAYSGPVPLEIKVSLCWPCLAPFHDLCKPFCVLAG